MIWIHIFIDITLIIFIYVFFYIKDRKRQKEFEEFIRGKLETIIKDFDQIADFHVSRLENKIKQGRKIYFVLDDIFKRYGERLPSIDPINIVVGDESKKNSGYNDESVKNEDLNKNREELFRSKIKNILSIRSRIRRFFKFIGFALKLIGREYKKEFKLKKGRDSTGKLSVADVQKKEDISTFEFTLAEETIDISGISNVKENKGKRVKPYVFKKVERNTDINSKERKSVVNESKEKELDSSKKSFVDRIILDLEAGIDEAEIIKKYNISLGELETIKRFYSFRFDETVV